MLSACSGGFVSIFANEARGLRVSHKASKFENGQVSIFANEARGLRVYDNGSGEGTTIMFPSSPMKQGG